MKSFKSILIALFFLTTLGIAQQAFAWTFYSHNEPYIIPSTPPTTNSVTLTANPTAVVLPGMPNTTNLTWTLAGNEITGCTASSTPATAWNGSVASNSGTYNLTILGLSVGTYIFDISCTVSAGPSPITDSALVVVSDNTPPSVTATITAIPSSITSGQSSTLVWSSTNATTCSGANFSTGGATGGTTSVSPTITTTYSVTCTGPSGSATDATTVTVTTTPPGGGGPSVDLTATSPVSSGSSSTLTWRVANATSCQASGAWSGSVAATAGTHTQQSNPLFAFSTFVIECTDGSRTARDEATVSIRGGGGGGGEDFSLWGTPLFKALIGGSATFTIGANPSGGFGSDINLAIQSSTIPGPATYDFNPTTLSCTTTSCSTSQLTITPRDALNPSLLYPIVVQGDGDGITRTTTVNIGARKWPIFREF